MMRKLLNQMMAMVQQNQLEQDLFNDTEHTNTATLYQAYEACLKNWYQETFNAEEEKSIRLDLMSALLFDNGWTYLDTEKKMSAPWIFVGRDNAGWMEPVPSLPYKNDPSYEKYRTINGLEINDKTGKVNFLLEPWRSDRSDYEKTFVLFDLQDMLERSLVSAFFSLDPVDGMMPYHPFNTMRYGPEQLAESELFNSMLLTDYMLKFLTVGQEVQGEYPFDQRSSCEMVSHLPERNIQPLVDAIHYANQADFKQQVATLYPHNQSHAIMQAVSSSSSVAAQSKVVRTELKVHLSEQRQGLKAQNKELEKIHLGAKGSAKANEHACFWVPASVKHNAPVDGHNRDSFFCYGGVNIQPKVNEVRSTFKPPTANRVGGSDFNRGRASEFRKDGFQDHHIISWTNKATKDHPLLKMAGFTEQNMHSRKNKIFLPTTEGLHTTRAIHSGRHT